MVLEGYSGPGKIIPYLDSYGKHSPEKVLDTEQMENMLVYQEAIIANLKTDVANLELKLHSLTHQSKLA